MLTTEEARKKWVEALRSGKYKQSIQFLHSEEGYCCLGVACDLFKEKHQKWEKSNFIYNFKNEKNHSYNQNYIPRSLARKIGIDNSNQECLSRLNDINRFSFKKIADYIEKNL